MKIAGELIRLGSLYWTSGDPPKPPFKRGAYYSAVWQ